MPVTLLTPVDRSDATYAGLVDAGAGLLVYRYLGCRYEPEKGEGSTEVTLWALYGDEARRYEIDRIEVQRPKGGPALSSTDLRAVPVASLFAGISHRAAWGTAEPAEGNSWNFSRPFNMPNNELPKKLDDGAYRKIGLVHRSHEILGNKATTELAKHFDVGRTTAYTWLKEIDDRGLMRPVVPPEEASKIGVEILQGDSMTPADLDAEPSSKSPRSSTVTPSTCESPSPKTSDSGP